MVFRKFFFRYFSIYLKLLYYKLYYRFYSLKYNNYKIYNIKNLNFNNIKNLSLLVFLHKCILLKSDEKIEFYFLYFLNLKIKLFFKKSIFFIMKK